MRERSHEVLAFLVGAAAGGAAALLLAPTSGQELRQKIGDQAERTRDDARERVRGAAESVSHRYEEATDNAHRLVTSARESADHYKDAVGAAIREGVKAYEREMKRAG